MAKMMIIICMVVMMMATMMMVMLVMLVMMMVMVVDNDWNDYRMTASSHPKRVLELYRDCFFWRWNDAGMTGWNEKQIRADSDRLHPCHIPSSWRAPGRTRG